MACLERCPKQRDRHRARALAPYNNGYGLYYAFGAGDSTNLGSGVFSWHIETVSVWNVPAARPALLSDMSQPPTGTIGTGA